MVLNFWAISSWQTSKVIKLWKCGLSNSLFRKSNMFRCKYKYLKLNMFLFPSQPSSTFLSLHLKEGSAIFQNLLLYGESAHSRHPLLKKRGSWQF